MKKLILVIVSVLVVSVSTVYAQKMPPEDQECIMRAIGLVDQGMYEAAMTDFDMLAKKYPDNYIVQYERLFTMFHLGKYAEVEKACKTLIKHKDVTPVAFEMYGNVVDILGKHDEALKIYKNGLKRFPDFGPLYLETGVVQIAQGKYDEALTSLNKGIEVDPDFSSNYFRAAQIYLQTDNMKVWGLVYAETEILLAPENSNRHSEMGTGIRKCFTESVQWISEVDSTKLKVSLAPSRCIIMNEKAESGYPEFPGVYEACAMGAAVKLLVNREPFTGTIAQLSELRKAIVEAYMTAGQNYYGNAMYLLPFHKSVIDAGHWDAYNHYIFGRAMQEEFDNWYDSHQAEFDSFVNWYNNAPFSLDNTHTVGINTIYRDCEPLSMLGILLYQASLLHLEENKQETEVE